MSERQVNDSVQWFMSELTSRIVAQSGIPLDRLHLGKIILQSFKDAPEFVCQVDGVTGQSETNCSVLRRTVQCATAFRNFGLQTSDVIVMMAPNHKDLIIPIYAAIYLGVSIAPLDRMLTVKELCEAFSIRKPKIIFCQSEKATDVQLTLNRLDSDSEIVTFDKGDYLCDFYKFVENYADNISVEDFRPNDFDPRKTIAFLLPTSGTTGAPKAASLTQANFIYTGPHLWSKYTQFPSPTRMALIGSPLQWLTAVVNIVIGPIMRFSLLMSRMLFTPEHAFHLINTYKPTYTILSPTLMTTLMRSRDECDFTCLEILWIGGSAVTPELIQEIKRITPKTEVSNIFGMTELSGLGFHNINSPPGSCGKPVGCFFYRLVDVQTQEVITKPNVAGELWIKGPGLFKGYYNNPVATKEAFAEGGWFKTGDMFYRDENWNYFFVDRIKLMLKYRGHHISPVEVESVIFQHPGVSDVAVTSISDPECGDLAVACVVRRPGHQVSAQEIKDLVTESLTETKQLRGGVIFLNEIPVTATTKVDRRKLKEMVVEMPRE